MLKYWILYIGWDNDFSYALLQNMETDKFWDKPFTFHWVGNLQYFPSQHACDFTPYFLIPFSSSYCDSADILIYHCPHNTETILLYPFTISSTHLYFFCTNITSYTMTFLLPPLSAVTFVLRFCFYCTCKLESMLPYSYAAVTAITHILFLSHFVLNLCLIYSAAVTILPSLWHLFLHCSPCPSSSGSRRDLNRASSGVRRFVVTPRHGRGHGPGYHAC